MRRDHIHFDHSLHNAQEANQGQVCFLNADIQLASRMKGTSRDGR